MSERDRMSEEERCDKNDVENIILPERKAETMTKSDNKTTEAQILSRDNTEKIKEEPKDDIKNFAEDTMNELLGWYGYEEASTETNGDPKHIRRQYPRKDKSHTVVTTRQDVESSNESNDSSALGGDRMSLTRHSQDSSLIDIQGAKYKTIESSTVNFESEEIIECKERSFVVCAWCEKGKTLDKHFVTSNAKSDEQQFCSEHCFDQSRHELYKKHKECEWCKCSCNSSQCVEFEDGGETFLFCSENCLNKYKMNIFCQETQEHMKKVQAEKSSTQPAQKSVPSDSRILITPELWAEENQSSSPCLPWKTGLDSRTSELSTNSKMGHSVSRPMPLQEKSRQRNTLASHGLPSSGLENNANTSNSLLRVVALKAKAEMEHPKSCRASGGSRPPRMTDREKIKQIRMRDRLPLHTPLRETYRGQTAIPEGGTYTKISQMKRDSSSPLQTSASGFLNTSHALSSHLPPLSASLAQMSPMSASQLFGVLAASQGMRPIPSHSVSPKPERARGMDALSDTSSSQSTSPRVCSSSELLPNSSDDTPAPPLYPPPNPFTHALPPYFNLPNGPFPFPTAPNLASLSALSSLYPPPFIPPSMPNIVPPSTLMVPYPFPLPLPIPIPIPIPIPQKLVDSLTKEKTPDAELGQNSEADSKENILQPGCKPGCRNYSRSQDGNTRLPCPCSSNSVFKQENTRRRSVSPTPNHQRYFLDTKRPSTDIQNDRAIDLSTDSARFRPKSLSPIRISQSSLNSNTLQANPLVIQPTSDTGSDLSPGPPSSPYAVTNSVVGGGCTSARYSSRRSLILDAPVAGNELARSPSPAEKRSYSGPSVRDILYGKRKCARPRIKTK